jgi:hypothetical protein
VSTSNRIDPDFALEILDELYTYRRKRPLVAWLLWFFLGWAGAHRFYLGREATGLVMLFTGGGGLIWWWIDAAFVGRMVRAHNTEQSRREAAGLPPLQLEFMPPLRREALRGPPPWLATWTARTRAGALLRFVGDLAVLLLAGGALGALAGVEGGAEGVVAVLVLSTVTVMGGRAYRFSGLPVVHGLIRWSHKLRLFYYYNRPGSPPALLLRPVTGVLAAPFRKRGRAEAQLYAELGAAFTIAFLMLDLVPEVLMPLFRQGSAALSPLRIARLWMQEAFMTFVMVYSFAAPIGAVLSLYVLTRDTHTVPRLLALFAVFSVAMGAFYAGFPL